MKMENGLPHPQKYPLIILADIKNMVNGHFQFTQLVDQFKGHLLHLIFDDRCKPEDATDRIREVYDLGKEKRKELGLKGREWCLSDEAGFNAKSQGENFIGAVNELFSKWEPREAFEVIDTDEDIRKIQTHNLVY